MKKIVVTVGVSGSGKSTFAHEQWKANPTGIVVVNRDKIRELLYSYTEETIQEYYLRPDLNKLEKQVTKYEDTLINEALCEDKTVIIDATHLERRWLDRFTYWNVPIEYKYFDISIDDAIERDSKRSRSVGAEIIKRQYNQYMELQRQGVPVLDFKPVEFKNNRNLPPCILYDIDGTIARMTNRSPYDWNRVGEDLVISEVTATLDWISDLAVVDRPTVIICTGRDGSCLEETKNWLEDNILYYDNIYIRAENDSRPDYIVKEEMWRKIAKDYYIVGMYDDRLQVTRRARSLGLKVFNVEYGNF